MWPHGILFRDSEQSMRQKLIESDIIDCVIGLGPNLFYNSVMEACIMVCRKSKPQERKGKILFINGFKEIIEEKQMAFLSDENIEALFGLYMKYENVPRLSYVANIDEVRKKDHNLNVPLYVEKYDSGEIAEYTAEIVKNWLESSREMKESSKALFSILQEVITND